MLFNANKNEFTNSKWKKLKWTLPCERCQSERHKTATISLFGKGKIMNTVKRSGLVKRWSTEWFWINETDLCAAILDGKICTFVETHATVYHKGWTLIQTVDFINTTYQYWFISYCQSVALMQSANKEETQSPWLWGWADAYIWEIAVCSV